MPTSGPIILAALGGRTVRTGLTQAYFEKAGTMRRQLGRTSSMALFFPATLMMTGPAPADGAMTRAVPTSRHAPAPRPPARAGGPTIAPADPQPLDRSFTWYHGLGFDTSSAPTLASMQSGLGSPYRPTGIYAARGG